MSRGSRTRKVLTLAAMPLRSREVAGDILGALLGGAFEKAGRMARTAAQTPDLGAEKIVSHNYRALWLCNPKVASRSTIAALLDMDPDAELVRDKTLAEIYSIHPAARTYFSFAFMRHPFDRTLSLYAEMRFHRQRFAGEHLRLKEERQRSFAKTFYGLAEVDSFDSFCQWLDTPYASDRFADRHFLSQHLQIRLPDGRLPDSIGRVDDLDEDLQRIAAHLGMPTPVLPMLNTRAGWAPAPDAVESARASMRTELSARNKALLQKRYAQDMELFETVATRKRL